MIPMQNWYASALTADKEIGLGEWEENDLADFLKTGVSERGAAFGPMAEVVGTSLQHLSDLDIRSMVTYLKSAPTSFNAESRSRSTAPAENDDVLKLGAKVYENQCATCHGADGKGAPPAYPPLAGNRSLAAEIAVNPVRMVLNGGYPPGTAGNPRPYGMPPFGTTLSDSEVAAVVSYIRASWGNQGTPVFPEYVTRLRGTPVD